MVDPKYSLSFHSALAKPAGAAQLSRRAALGLGAAALAGGAGLRRARAAEPVRIGCLFPMSGDNAQVGIDNLQAMLVMADIINGEHAPLPMLLGAGGGLRGLGNRPVQIVAADHEGSLQKARSEAERLITQEAVVAIIGSYQSATAAAIGQVTERFGLPFISADNSSPALTQRGLKWFFRTGPHDEMFTAAMIGFITEMGARSGNPVQSTTLFYEDSIFGNDSSAAERRLITAQGISVAADIRYRANSLSLTVEAGRIKNAGADMLMPSSYTNDAILLLNTMAAIGYRPPVIMSQAAGFQQPAFLASVGELAEGVFSRSSFALDVGNSRPAIQPVNAQLKARTGKDLTDNTSRVVVALQVLADALQRAGSTEPNALRTALLATDIAGDQTIMPWKGVRFDETGQNVACTPVVQQVRAGRYQTVYPFEIAPIAPAWKLPA